MLKKKIQEQLTPKSTVNESHSVSSADHKEWMTLVRAVASGDGQSVLKIVKSSPDLALKAAIAGATRTTAKEYFLPEIRHYIYEGDTALHVAAAGFKFAIAQVLLDYGARCDAKNRRGAEPLHYASDSNSWNPDAQVATIQCLIRAGADPNATDKSGVAPLHRAARTRCAAAVRALLAGGAKSDLRNNNGSTSLHLAVQNTGRGGTGSAQSVEQQRQIIMILLENGADRKAKDGNGKTIDRLATARWIRELLQS